MLSGIDTYPEAPLIPQGQKKAPLLRIVDLLITALDEEKRKRSILPFKDLLSHYFEVLDQEMMPLFHSIIQHARQGFAEHIWRKRERHVLGGDYGSAEEFFLDISLPLAELQQSFPKGPPLIYPSAGLKDNYREKQRLFLDYHSCKNNTDVHLRIAQALGRGYFYRSYNETKESTDLIYFFCWNDEKLIPAPWSIYSYSYKRGELHLSEQPFDPSRVHHHFDSKGKGMVERLMKYQERQNRDDLMERRRQVCRRLKREPLFSQVIEKLQSIKFKVQNLAKDYGLVLYGEETFERSFQFNTDPKYRFLDRENVPILLGDPKEERSIISFCERIEAQWGVSEEQKREWCLQIEATLIRFSEESEMGGTSSLDWDSLRFLLKEGRLAEAQVNMVRHGAVAVRLFNLYQSLGGREAAIFSFFPDVHVMNRLFYVYYKQRETALKSILQDIHIKSNSVVNIEESNELILESFAQRPIRYERVSVADQQLSLPIYYWPEDKELHLAEALGFGQFKFRHEVAHLCVRMTVQFETPTRIVPIGTYDVSLEDGDLIHFVHDTMEELTREFKEDMLEKAKVVLQKLRSDEATRMQEDPFFIDEESQLQEMGLRIEKIATAYGFEVNRRSHLKHPFKFGKNYLLSHWNAHTVSFTQKILSW
ncbi:MAG: hypothetical protein KBC64_00175 [Simkaniaceae bacterium]|nr:hypothetical protein [Simkaniaceae bacterium]